MVASMVLEAFGEPLVRREFPLPELEPGAVLVRLLASGVCGSDVEITAGRDPRTPLPLIPGHEGLGEIVAVGGERLDVHGRPLVPGMGVAFGRGLTCGRCVFCTIRRQPALCPHRQTYGISLSCADWPHLNGCYAEMLYVRPASEIMVLPPEAEPVGMVAATCSGATAAHAVELAGVEPGQVVVVIGPGPLGLYAAALARERGAREVIVMGRGRDPRQLRLAEAGGALPISMAETTAEERRELVYGLNEGRGADAVLDCAGTTESLTEAVAMVGTGGVVAIPGVAAPMAAWALDPYRLARQQIRVQGVWVSEPRHLWQALQVAHSGRYPLDSMVTEVLPLSRANEALELARSRRALKVVLVPD